MSLLTETNATVLHTSHIITPSHATESVTLSEDNMMLMSNARFDAAVNTTQENKAIMVSLDKSIPKGSIIIKIVVLTTEALTRNQKEGSYVSADVALGLYTAGDLLVPTSWDEAPFDGVALQTLDTAFNNKTTTRTLSHVYVSTFNETLKTGTFSIKVRYMLE
jgi:hypothetical protein